MSCIPGMAALHAARLSGFAGTSGRLAAPSSSSRAVRAAPFAVVALGPTPLKTTGLLGTKAGMTQLFTDKGDVVPVTVIAIGSGNVVTQVKGGGEWVWR